MGSRLEPGSRAIELNPSQAAMHLASNEKGQPLPSQLKARVEVSN